MSTIPKNGLNDWYAGVLIVNTQNKKVPVVWDPYKDNPRWKLPGGKKEPGETPEMTALREIRQETGLVLRESDLMLVHEEDKWNHPSAHTMFFFMAFVEDFNGLTDRGDEGEYVKEVYLADIPVMAQDPTEEGFLYSHWKHIEPVVMEGLS